MKPESNTGVSSLWTHVLFAAALVLAVLVIQSSFSAATLDPASDDGYYLKYMQSVHEHGLGVLPKLFDDWNANRQHWIYPPPSRVGFIAVSALWAAMFGASLTALQYLSVASFLAGAVATYLFAARHFGQPRALFIGVLWLFSPLLMGLSRLALTDSFIALCMSLCAWLFLEIVLEPGSWRRRILFMAVFGFTVLVKELSVLLIGPFAAFVLVERFVRKEPLNLGVFALVFTLPGLVVAPLFVLAAGDVPKLLETTRIVLESPATNDYAIRYGSGPWFRYVVDFMCLSPCTTLLAIAFLGLLLVRVRNGNYDRRLVFLALIAVCMIFEYSFFTKNLRYTVLLELPIRVFSVCLVCELCRAKTPSRTWLLAGIVVAFLCWVDWQAFELYWVRYRGYDPVTYLLLGMRHMIPYPVR
jgi:4-amino-4-deoxy-L-arabinose transferase-like glycosyltransferase